MWSLPSPHDWSRRSRFELGVPWDFRAVVETMVQSPRFRDIVRFHDGEASPVPRSKDPDTFLSWLHHVLGNGTSLTFQFEHLEPAHRPMRELSDAVFAWSGLPTTVHLYVSAPGARVLRPHTDPYDVLVVGLLGSKRWHTCVPPGEGSEADRCLRQEYARDSIEGCTPYPDEPDEGVECDRFEMHAGDALFMPKGVVHHARTLDAVTMHLTLGMRRTNLQWFDAFHYLLTRGTCRKRPSGTVKVLERYMGTEAGVRAHQAVPARLLRCAPVTRCAPAFSAALSAETTPFLRWMASEGATDIEWLADAARARRRLARVDVPPLMEWMGEVRSYRDTVRQRWPRSPGCVDGGPWPCDEDGCPAPTVECSVLAPACRYRFDAIWTRPPAGTAARLVSDACPWTCGGCLGAA